MILIKEEFVGGEKWRRAVKLGGSDAITLWIALKCYCSLHPDTEGFVPDEVLDELPGAPAPRARRKALQALIECGRLLPGGERGAGLVESAEGGWQLHDYLDHSASPEEIELRREKQRLRKQSYRQGKRRELDAVRRLSAELAELGEPPLAGHPLGAGDNAGHVPWDRGDTERDMSHGTEGTPSGTSQGDTELDKPGDTSEDTRGTSLAGACPPACERAPAPTRGRARPNPAQPNPTHKKTLRRPPSTIRVPGELDHPVEACAEHRQFATEHGLDLEEFLVALRLDPFTARLSRDEIRTRLASMLVSATTARRQSLGGAA